MPDSDSHIAVKNTPLQNAPAVSPAVVAASVAVLAAAWFAAGSAGLMGEALTRILSWTALGTAAVLLRPTGKTLAMLGAIVAVLIGLPFVISAFPSEILSLPAYNVLLVVSVSSILAAASEGIERRALMASAVAVAVLAVFRIGCDCVPMIWHTADFLGHILGTLVAAVYGRELCVGSSFAGLDFLVTMAAFSTVWLWSGATAGLASSAETTVGQANRGTHQNDYCKAIRRVIYAVVAILVVQFFYLSLLTHAENLIAALPDLPPPPSTDPAEYRPPDWSLAVVLRGMIPWNLPLVAMVGNLLVAACMLRWVRIPQQDNSKPVWHDPERSEGRGKGCSENHLQAENPRPSLRSGSCHTRSAREYLSVILVSALAAVVLTWAVCPSNLKEKKVLAYADSDVWALPEHGGLDLSAADGYGMLAPFVASLGGKFAVSQSLSETDLEGADVLIMIDPAKPLHEDALARVHNFVRGGGSLLLLAGPADQDSHDRATVDAILEPIGMGVRFDMTVTKTPHWQDAARAFVHPATIAVNPRRNQFALYLGSSIALHGGGQPILLGRWGWCEPGSDMATTGVSAYDQGEKLGDIVLAAERGLGDGTIVILSDTTG
ncbi:MAG: hypothetical protein JXM70_25945, partial [Pirellulales bacterium]|nr:hypothetical protein [Pirellulales bacterium]